MYKIMKNSDVIHFVGIDISKKTLDVSIIISKQRNSVQYHQFKNDKPGCKQIINWVEQLTNNQLGFTIFCMEHTGIYCKPLLHELMNNNCLISLESPIEIKRSLGLQRGKNDKVDSKRICLYSYKNIEDLKLWTPPREVVVKIKEILNHRDRLVDCRTRLLDPIHEHEDMGDQNMARMLRISCKKSCIAIDKDIDKSEVLLNELISSDETIRRLYTLINSVNGIGLITTLRLICDTNEMTLFKSAKQLACYCGVAPFEHKSGTSISGKTRVSQMANKKLKTLLCMCALAAIKKDKELREYYLRKVSEGKNKMLVINSIKNKLLIRIVAVVERGSEYVDNYKIAA